MTSPTEKKLVFPMILLVVATIFIAVANWYVGEHNIKLSLFAGTKDKEVIVSFYPKEITADPGKEITVAPMILSNSKNKKPAYIDLWITYDATALTYITTDPPNAASDMETLFVTEQTGDTPTHAIHIVYGLKEGNAAFKELHQLPNMKFLAIKPTTSSVTIDPSKSQVTFLNQENAELVIKPTTITIGISPSPVASISATLTPTVTKIPTRTPTKIPTIKPTIRQMTTPTKLPQLSPTIVRSKE